jgi:hypothetical protein
MYSLSITDSKKLIADQYQVLGVMTHIMSLNNARVAVTRFDFLDLLE